MDIYVYIYMNMCISIHLDIRLHHSNHAKYETNPKLTSPYSILYIYREPYV